MKHELPSGGPLKVDAKVAEVFVAHISGVCAGKDQESRAAFRKRDSLLKSLGEPGRRHVRLVSEVLAGLCPR